MQNPNRPELFIGLVGPIGVDLEYVQSVISKELKHLEYETVPLRITELMRAVETGVVIEQNSTAPNIIPSSNTQTKSA